MSNMDRIVKFAKRVEMTTSHGGCPVKKLFVTDGLIYSDFAVVPMGKEIDDVIDKSNVVYKLRVEITMRRARREYESKWGWKPDKYGHGMLTFYHHDFDAMLEFAANYLEEHIDPLVGPYTVSEMRGVGLPIVVTCIKHKRIGRLLHISLDPDYESYKIE